MKFLANTLLMAALAAGACYAQLPLFDDERPRLPGRMGSGSASALADVDGDGMLDVVRVSGGSLDVLIQEKSGGFVRKSGPVALGLPSGASPVSLCTGLLAPGATHPDIVVGVTGADSLLFRNDGSGTFGQQVPSPLPRPLGFSGATTQVVVANFDNAVGDDVLVLHDGAQPQLFMLQSTGAFTERGSNLLPPGFFPQSPYAAVADFTGNGMLDAVVVRRGIPAVPILLASQGGGRLSVRAGAFMSTAYSASVLAAGDVTVDGAPDIVLASSAAGGGSLRVLANDGTGGFAPLPIISFSTGVVVDLEVGRIDSDARDDIAILQDDGTVDVSLSSGSQFATLTNLLPRGSRKDLSLGDLEGDNDGDLYVLGSFLEDSLLLADKTGSFVATEEVTVPAATLSRRLMTAAVDVTGDGDPDLVGYDGAGTSVCLVNDGSARFDLAPNLLPNVATVVRDVVPLSTVSVGSEDLLLLGSRTGSLRVGVSLLVSQGGRMVDQTATRWPLNIAGSLEAIGVGDLVDTGATTSGFDDVVAVDDQGGLLLFTNNNGVFTASFAFGFATVLGPVQVVTGRLDGDARLDVVVLTRSGPPAVFLQQANGSFRQVPQPNIGPIPARQGIITEATGDGIADLLIVSRAQPSRLFLLQGVGDGSFTDQSGKAPSPLPADLSVVAAIGGSSRVQPAGLVFGSGAESDVMFTSNGSLFTGRSVLPDRGSHRTSQVIVRDLDVDGDEDLVIGRAGTLPRVLLAQTFQLSSRGIAQNGRDLAIRVRAPHVGSAAILISGSTRRLPLLNWGLLRLNPSAGLIQLASFPIPATGVFDLTIPTQVTYPEFELPMQMGYLDMVQGRFSLSNLEFQSAVAH